MRNKKKENIDSYIGKNAEFEGRLSFSGTVRIDGKFKGEIDAGGYLIVGSEGRIEGDITAGSIVSSGEIWGAVTAKELIELRVPAKLRGDIQAPKIAVREGVVLEGNCRVTGGEKGEGAGGGVLKLSADKPKGAKGPKAIPGGGGNETAAPVKRRRAKKSG